MTGSGMAEESGVARELEAESVSWRHRDWRFADAIFDNG